MRLRSVAAIGKDFGWLAHVRFVRDAQADSHSAMMESRDGHRGERYHLPVRTQDLEPLCGERNGWLKWSDRLGVRIRSRQRGRFGNEADYDGGGRCAGYSATCVRSGSASQDY